MADVLTLMATLGLDASEYEKGLDQASDDAESFGSKIGGALFNAAKNGVEMLAKVSEAVIDLGKQFTAAVGDVAAFGDNIDKSSQKMGISAEAYQEWDFVLQHAGSSIDAMKMGMKTLTKAVASDSEAFKKLGISKKKVASMSKDELFAETITALQNVSDETERATLAEELFGRSAMDMGALLNMSAEETSDMLKQVHDLGGVMSGEAVTASAAYQDSLQNLNTALSGAKNNLASEFLPGFTNVMDGLTGIFIGDNGAAALIVEGIYNIVDNLRTLAPKITKNIKNIVKKIMPALKVAVKSIGEVLNDILPVAIDLLSDLIPVISDALPGIIQGVLPALIQGAGQLIAGLVSNLPGILNALWTGLKAALSSIWTAFSEAYPAAAEAAENIVGFFVTAWDNIKAVWNSVTSFFSGLWDSITSNPVLVAIGDLLAAPFKQTWNNIKLVWDTVAAYFKGIWGLITGEKSLSEVGESLKKPFTDAWGKIEEVWNGIVTFFADLWKGLKEDETFGGISTTLSGLFTSAWDTWTVVWNGIKTFFVDLFNIFTGDKDITSVTNNIGKLFTDAWDNFTKVWDGLVSYFTNLWNSLTDNEIVKAVGTTLSGFFTDAWADIQKAWDGAAEWFGGIWKDIKGFVEDPMKYINGLIESGVDWVQSFWDKCIELKNAIGGIWGEISATTKEWWDKIVGWIQPAIDLVNEFLNLIDFDTTNTDNGVNRYMQGQRYGGGTPYVQHENGGEGGGRVKHASAMENGEILRGITPFGFDQAGNVHYGGEAGAEAVVGVNSLRDMVHEAARNAIGGLHLQVVLDSGVLVGEIAPAMDEQLNDLATWKEGGRA